MFNIGQCRLYAVQVHPTWKDWERLMLRNRRERFKELCEHAEVVEDKNKLSKIAEEIDRILDDELDRLKKIRISIGNPQSVRRLQKLCEPLRVSFPLPLALLRTAV